MIDDFILFLKKRKKSDDFDSYIPKKRTYFNKYNNNKILNNYNINNSPNEIKIFYEQYMKLGESFSQYNNEKNIPLIDFHSLNEIYSNLAFITLGNNLYHLLINVDITKRKKYYIDILNKLINILKNSNKDNFTTQYALKFLVNLMEKVSENFVDCTKELLMDYFKSKYFFRCNKNELNDKKKLINCLTSKYPKIFNDLFNSLNDYFFFFKKTDEEKKDILKRISFVIYSCEKDVFTYNFLLIQEKFKNILSNYNENDLLKEEIFLSLRMIFWRADNNEAMKIFRDLWPIIFTELITNIMDKDINRHFYLFLESVKFIELLSLVNIEEFSLYQWIFIIDSYDIKDLDTENKESLISKLIIDDKNLFKPLLLRVIGKKELNSKKYLIKEEIKGKSELYIKTRNFENLIDEIKKLFFSVREFNNYNVSINFEQIEEVILNDFLGRENAFNPQRI